MDSEVTLSEYAEAGESRAVINTAVCHMYWAATQFYPEELSDSVETTCQHDRRRFQSVMNVQID